MQQYKLGQYFRRRYGKILGEKYTPNCIYVQSTDVDRTYVFSTNILTVIYDNLNLMLEFDLFSFLRNGSTDLV